MNFYLSVFADAAIESILLFGPEGPGEEGTLRSCVFELEGEQFQALNGGPAFSFTPAISFFVNCDREEEADALWDRLADRGEVLMELQKYPFGEKYGWIQDRFGISWQIMLMSSTQKIVPHLLFGGKQQGRAFEAMEFYTRLFDHAEILSISRYATGKKGIEGTVKQGRFLLNGQEFRAMDSGLADGYVFTPAISLAAECETQLEIDRLWKGLAAEGGEPGVAGWIQDRFGVSWQIVPVLLNEMLQSGEVRRLQRVRQALLSMEKIEIALLQAAWAEHG